MHLVEAEEILENECMRALVVEKITILPDAYRIVLPSPDNQIPDYVPEDLIKAILEARNR